MLCSFLQQIWNILMHHCSNMRAGECLYPKYELHVCVLLAARKLDPNPESLPAGLLPSVWDRGAVAKWLWMMRVETPSLGTEGFSWSHIHTYSCMWLVLYGHWHFSGVYKVLHDWNSACVAEEVENFYCQYGWKRENLRNRNGSGDSEVQGQSKNKWIL